MPAANRARILFVIGSLGGGGAERQLVDLIQRLDRSRFEPMLLLAYRTGELLPEIPADVPIMAYVDGPSEQTLRQRLAAKFRLLSEARARHLRGMLRRQPVDLIFSWGLRMTYETALATRSARIPRIAYCVAEPGVELEIDFKPRIPGRKNLARWAYSSTDKVYANSEGVRRQLIELYGLPAEQAELFLNLRDFSRLERQAEAFTPQWPHASARIVTVGRLHFQKGHSVLIDAVADLIQRRQRDVQLTIVGGGPHESILRQQVQQLGLVDRIVFAGFQSNPAPYYRHAELFVMPSLTEGLPNVLIEAVVLGTPSISADCPTGPREILEGGRYGTLVPPGDAAALANAIEYALDHLPEEQARAKVAQKAVRAKYDVNLGIRPLEDRLLNVIATSRHQAGRG